MEVLKCFKRCSRSTRESNCTWKAVYGRRLLTAARLFNLLRNKCTSCNIRHSGIPINSIQCMDYSALLNKQNTGGWKIFDLDCLGFLAALPFISHLNVSSRSSNKAGHRFWAIHVKKTCRTKQKNKQPKSLILLWVLTGHGLIGISAENGAPHCPMQTISSRILG